MTTPGVLVRHARASDARAMADIDARSWRPADLATTQAEFVARMLAYPAGQLVAEVRGIIAGCASAQRVDESFLLENSHSYDIVTDHNRFTNSASPGGDVYQLVGVGVAPEFRGTSIGRVLVDRQIEQARTMSGIRRIVGFTRPVHFHRYPRLTFEEYRNLRNEQGELIDPVLAFHLTAGAKIVSVHENFRPDDIDSRGVGVLIEYPDGS